MRHARGGPFDGLEITASEDDNTILLLDFGESTFAPVVATYNVAATKSALVEIFGMGACLSAALAQAVRWNLIVRNPVALVEPPHEEQKEPRPLTPDQAAALLAIARGHEFEQLYTVMLATGQRISEALGLRWFDPHRAELGGADLDAREIHVRQQLTIIPGQPWRLTPPKSRSGRRTVPLIPAAVGALQAQRKPVLEFRVRCPADWPEHDLVFCDELGQPIVGRRVERVFKQHLERAGLPMELTPHSLRHSCKLSLTNAANATACTRRPPVAPQDRAVQLRPLRGWPSLNGTSMPAAAWVRVAPSYGSAARADRDLAPGNCALCRSFMH